MSAHECNVVVTSGLVWFGLLCPHAWCVLGAGSTRVALHRCAVLRALLRASRSLSLYTREPRAQALSMARILAANPREGDQHRVIL